MNIDKLSDCDNAPIHEGKSLVSCCMNRNEHIKESLKSWLKLDFNELILVDWSSEIPLSETLSEFDDNRITIVRVTGEPEWVLAYAYNVGLRLAKYSVIYKFDADISISEDFLNLNPVPPDKYIRGNWQHAMEAGKPDQRHVNGTFIAHKEHLKSVVYFNEYIRSYGWDDSDLYERLSIQQGLGVQWLDINSVHHLDQEEESRLKHQTVRKTNFLGTIPATEFSNLRNKFIGRAFWHWDKTATQDYEFIVDEPGYLECRRITADRHIYITAKDANIYAAMDYIRPFMPEISRTDDDPKINSQSFKGLAEFIYNEYEYSVPIQETRLFLGVDEGERSVYFYQDETAKPDDFLSAHSVNSLVVIKSNQYHRQASSKSPGTTLLFVSENELRAILNKLKYEGIEAPEFQQMTYVECGI